VWSGGNLPLPVVCYTVFHCGMGVLRCYVFKVAVVVVAHNPESMVDSAVCNTEC
jgi:hypothetical protein